jgi:hypothetical protein
LCSEQAHGNDHGQEDDSLGSETGHQETGSHDMQKFFSIFTQPSIHNLKASYFKFILNLSGFKVSKLEQQVLKLSSLDHFIYNKTPPL